MEFIIIVFVTFVKFKRSSDQVQLPSMGNEWAWGIDGLIGEIPKEANIVNVQLLGTRTCYWASYGEMGKSDLVMGYVMG